MTKRQKIFVAVFHWGQPMFLAYTRLHCSLHSKRPLVTTLRSTAQETLVLRHCRMPGVITKRKQHMTTHGSLPYILIIEWILVQRNQKTIKSILLPKNVNWPFKGIYSQVKNHRLKQRVYFTIQIKTCICRSRKLKQEQFPQELVLYNLVWSI